MKKNNKIILDKSHKIMVYIEENIEQFRDKRIEIPEEEFKRLVAQGKLTKAKWGISTEYTLIIPEEEFDGKLYPETTLVFLETRGKFCIKSEKAADISFEAPINGDKIIFEYSKKSKKNNEIYLSK